MSLAEWIGINTADCNVVVEFGAMFGDALQHARSKKRIGIEIHGPYIARAKLPLIHGDFKDFESLIPESDMECAMFIDSLEHLEMEEAFDLIGRVQKKFSKILLHLPEGNHPQSVDVFNLGADVHQTHKSTWHVPDVERMGFQEIKYFPNYHSLPGKDPGAIFAIWRKV